MPLAPVLTELTEHLRDWKPADLRVDRERRLVRNVALTAIESRNGYRYAEEALRQALSLYEGKPVFLDHPPSAGRPYDRSARDLVGTIVDPRFEDGRVRGDIRVLDTDAGRTFLGLVESDSPAVGMSHVVLAERDGDGDTVERIHDVISVDAVMFPATAATFRASTVAAATEPVGRSSTPSVSEAELDVHSSPAADEVELRPTDTEAPDVTNERDRLAREIEELRRELEQLRTERNRIQDEQEIDRLLAEFHLPPAVITEVFRRQLRSESDHAARQALIAERQTLVRQLEQRTPHSRERPADAPTHLTDDRIAALIRRR